MIYFPPSPATGQEYVGVNGVTYTWTGDRWSGAAAFEQNTTTYYIDGGDASFSYNSARDGLLDGGLAYPGIPGIEFVSIDESSMSGTGEITVNYHIDNFYATEAGVILIGQTTNHTQTATAGPYSQGANSYTIGVDYQLWWQVVNIVVFYVDGAGYTHYAAPYTQELGGGPCLVEGTMITMSDGTHRAIETIQHGELIRTWNFDLGEFSEAHPIWIKQAEETNGRNIFTFSDGTVLQTVGHHVFNKQAGRFTYLVKDETPVGTVTFNEHGEEITLVSKEIVVDTPTRYYNVWTQYHLNLFANGILTSNRFNNMYPIENMKFVKHNATPRAIEEFAGIDPKYIQGLRLQEQPYSVEYMRDYVEKRIERLDIANAPIEEQI